MPRPDPKGGGPLGVGCCDWERSALAAWLAERAGGRCCLCRCRRASHSFVLEGGARRGSAPAGRGGGELEAGWLEQGRQEE